MVGLTKVILFSLVLSALIYPGLEKLYLYRQTYILEDLVMAPLSFLGEGQTILSNDDKFTRYGTNYKSLDLLPNRDLFTGIKNEFKFHERWVNLSNERDRIFEERMGMINNYYEKIKNDTYSMIVYGPDNNELDIYYLIYGLQVILPKISEGKESNNLNNYCEVFLPTVEHKCTACKDLVRVFFRENKSCDNNIWGVVDYYRKNFYKICELNELTANTKIKVALAGNGFIIFDKCENGGKLLFNYNDKKFRVDDFLTILYIAATLFFLRYFRTNSKVSGYALLVLSILILPLYLFNENYVSDSYTNESVYQYKYLDLPNEVKALEKPHSVDVDKIAAAGKLTLRNETKEWNLPLLRYGGDFSKG